MNNGHREENSFCCFHPNEVAIGVCPLCLNERLLVLASKQGHHSSSRSTRRAQSSMYKKPPITLPKIFALGSFLSRLEFRHWKSDNPYHDASTSQEDSFISIKFEDNGVGSWEKNTLSKVSLENYNIAWDQSLSKESNKETKTVIEHGKPRVSLRWRKRIGHLFQVIRWKRSNKANVGSKVEGVKVRKGWIRTLTKRKTME
ncbi:hypothetical protein CMV_013428 [Castanea mollissima]|uniref:Uncharacterized protein n=1 Tax=Castanea mollissima TaxID=60419 RepID=A0A8J4QZU6_9ROSI|nr:hypothetical protein CMV_013428 [Castanea mollissima]